MVKYLSFHNSFALNLKKKVNGKAAVWHVRLVYAGMDEGTGEELFYDKKKFAHA
jgi:hypothetical protein